MKTKLLAIFSSILILLFISDCGPNFNTDFDPPPPDAKLSEVFPDQIAGMKGKISKRSLRGRFVDISSSYGDGKIVLSVIQFPDKKEADGYFKSDIVPVFDKMKNNFRGNINGKWKASGTDTNGRKFFSWVNRNWILLINGSDNNYFKMAIDVFKYIEE